MRNLLERSQEKGGCVRLQGGGRPFTLIYHSYARVAVGLVVVVRVLDLTALQEAQQRQKEQRRRQ